MKRLVFCFDGTWNKIDSESPTNVAKLAQAVCHTYKGVRQIVHYDEGIGTKFLERKLGGAFGYGLAGNVAEAYHFLVLNYEPGDDIFAFGFSRGAFTARSFVGLLRNCGIISRRELDEIGNAVALYRSRAPDAHPGSQRMREFRYRTRPDLCLPGDREWRRQTIGDERDSTDLTVEYVGVWDTVASLGIPPHVGLPRFLSSKYQFHDARLSKFVKAARHAVAADERRITFSPSLWTNLDDLNPDSATEMPYQQMLFPGPHGAVGGGGPIVGLSDAALDWVLRGALMRKLGFDADARSPLHGLRPDHRDHLFNAKGKTRWSLGDRAMGLGLETRNFNEIDVTEIHPSLLRRYKESGDQLAGGQEYRPVSLKHLHDAILALIAKHGRDFEAMPGDPPKGAVLFEIRPYTVQAGDTLTSIAAGQMGDAKLMPQLYKHNRRNGILFDPNDVRAGQTIEIPIYGDAAEAGRSAGDEAGTATDGPRCSL